MRSSSASSPLTPKILVTSPLSLRVRFKPTAKDWTVRLHLERTNPIDVAAIIQTAKPVVASALMEKADPKVNEVVVAVSPLKLAKRLRPLSEKLMALTNPAKKDAVARESPLTLTHPQEIKTKLKVETTVNASLESPKTIMKKPKQMSSEVVKPEGDLDLLVSQKKAKKLDLPASAHPESQESLVTLRNPALKINNVFMLKETRRDLLVRTKETIVITSTEATEAAKVSQEVAEAVIVVVSAHVASSAETTVAPRAKPRAATLSTGDSQDAKVLITKTEVLPASTSAAVLPEVASPSMASSRTNESMRVYTL